MDLGGICLIVSVKKILKRMEMFGFDILEMKHFDFSILNAFSFGLLLSF